MNIHGMGPQEKPEQGQSRCVYIFKQISVDNVFQYVSTTVKNKAHQSPQSRTSLRIHGYSPRCQVGKREGSCFLDFILFFFKQSFQFAVKLCMSESVTEGWEWVSSPRRCARLAKGWIWLSGFATSGH